MSILSALLGGMQAMGSAGIAEPLHRELGQMANVMFPNQMPTAAQAVMAWRAGLINDFNCIIACFAQGLEPPEELLGRFPLLQGPIQSQWMRRPVWHGVHKLNVGHLGIAETIAMRAKGLLSDGSYAELTKRNNWWNPFFLRQAEDAYQNQYPSASELVTFALRECWDQATVNRYQYDAEFPTEFKEFMKRLGFDGQANPNPGNVNANANTPTWSQIYWRAHWRIISPTQAYEMFQRLRPNRLDRFGALPNLRTFTLEDLRTSLKVNDFPAPFRDQLAAIAYRKPRLVDIDRFYTSDQITKQEVYELHLDLGYSPADARMRTDWLEQEKIRKPNNTAAKRLPRRIVDLFLNGRLSEAQAKDRLMDVLSGGRYTTYHQRDENWEGVDAAAPMRRNVDNYLGEALAAREVARSKRLVNAYRRQYLHGQINVNDLTASMHQAGFTQQFIWDLIRDLDTELASGRLMLSTERIRRLTIQGIMPYEVAKEYLFNLGWKEPEVGYMLAQLSRDIELEALHAQERMENDEEKRESNRLRQAALAARKRNQVIQRLNRQATPAQLKKYFVRNIIGETEYERELRRRGYNDDEVKRRLQADRIDQANYRQGRRRRAAAAAPPGPAAANQPQGTQTPQAP